MIDSGGCRSAQRAARVELSSRSAFSTFLRHGSSASRSEAVRRLPHPLRALPRVIMCSILEVRRQSPRSSETVDRSRDALVAPRPAARGPVGGSACDRGPVGRERCGGGAALRVRRRSYERPTLQAWRGVTVHADAARCGRGCGRCGSAPYSYDLVDNLGRRSPRELRDVPEPRPGGPFTRAFGIDQGRVVAVDPGRELHGARSCGAHMSYAVLPEGDATRLLPQGRHAERAGGCPCGVRRRPRDGPQAAAHPQGARRGRSSASWATSRL